MNVYRATKFVPLRNDRLAQEKGNIDTRHCSLCTTHLMNGNRSLLPSNSLPECRKYCLFRILERDRQWCTWRHHYPIMSAAHVVHQQSSGWLLISHPWKGGFYFLFKVSRRKKDKTFFKIVIFQHWGDLGSLPTDSIIRRIFRRDLFLTHGGVSEYQVLACEQALLFGRVKRVSRGSLRLPK